MSKTEVNQERAKKKKSDFSPNEIRTILLEKIAEEEEVLSNNSTCYQDDLTYKKNKANIVSLFSGAGGLDLGVEFAGLDVVLGEEKVDEIIKNKKKFDKVRHKGIFHHVYANDFFKEALETYEKNFNKTVFLHNEDIRKISKFPKADLVLGGFPCPGFSEAGPRLIDDSRNFLYLHFIRCLLDSRPKFFIAENVKGMLTLGKGEVFKQIKEDFSAAGYNIYYKLLNARDYGVPQNRERVFLIGVRLDIDFEYKFIEPTHGNELFLKPYTTLRDSIGDLEFEPGEYFTGSYSSIYMSRNRKKGWNDQSFTIQASGRHAPIHPSGKPMKKIDRDKWVFSDGIENNRRLSVKEIARIQTFPDWFEFSDGDNKRISKNGRLNKIYKQIGNAVPVELARVVARPIADWFVNKKGGDHL